MKYKKQLDVLMTNDNMTKRETQMKEVNAGLNKAGNFELLVYCLTLIYEAGSL